MKIFRFIAAAVVALSFGTISSIAQAAPLVIYDPTGLQNPNASDLAPGFVASGVTASVLHNAGPGAQGANTNVRPVRVGPGALDISGGYYLQFTLDAAASNDTLQLSNIDYRYASYISGSTFAVSLLTSADGFSSVVDTAFGTGATNGLFNFDASSVLAFSAPLQLRLYFHDLVGGGNFGSSFMNVDWADIVSSNAGGFGMRVNGEFIANGVPAPGALALLGLGLLGIGAFRRRKAA
jgi:hypothetical protein